MNHATSTFDTAEPNLGEVLGLIREGKIQLPDFQRGWVWDDNRIRAIISSVSKAYPIGAIMTMEVGDSVRFLPRPFEGVELLSRVTPQILVLDGQQRLTALYLSLMNDKPVTTTTDKKKEIRRYYYIDIEKALDQFADRLDAIVSLPENRMITTDFGRQVVLDLSSQELEYKNGMFPLHLIYNLSGFTEWERGFMEYFNNAPERFQFFSRFRMEVWLRFQQYKVPVIELTKETPKDAVCQVFENVNTGGVSLTVFELMTATYAAENFALREDWEKHRERIRQLPVLKSVDESAFLTALTLLASYKRHVEGKSAVSCKRKDVLELSLADYKKNADPIIEGMLSAAKLLAREKIFDQRDLPYQTQLVPLSAICAYLGDKVENDTVKEKIIQWYWCGVFGELYGGANETRYALDVSGVINWLGGGEVPATVRDANFAPTRLLTLQTRISAAYKGLMALLMTRGSRDFLSGDPIELTTYFDNNIDIHHIFPATYCQNQNMDPQKWNSIVNKAALSSRTNRILGGHRPSTYIQTIQKQYGVNSIRLDEILDSHLIDQLALRTDDFAGFVLKRAGLLLDLIQDATGKTIVGRDSEETLMAFGGALTKDSAIEVRQETKQNQSTPRSKVYGQKKDMGKIEKQWEETSFFKDLEERRGPEETEIARKILGWAKDKMPRFWWGRGNKDGSVYPILDYNGKTYYPIGIWSYGKVEIQFQYLKRNTPFDSVEKRIALLDLLNQIPGLSIPADAISRRPNVYLSAFKNDNALKQFIGTLDWVVHEIKKT
jgi:hypothetical protein